MGHTTCCSCCSLASALHASVETLLAQSSRKLTHSITHYWTEAESTQWRIQEARQSMSGATKLHRQEGSRGMPGRREGPFQQPAAQSQWLVFHSPSSASLQDHHTPVTSIPRLTPKHHLQLCFCRKLLHLHSVIAHGLLNKEHGNSQITQWVIAENTRRCDKPHTSNWSLASACHKTFVFLAYWKGHHPPLLQFASCLNQK